MSQPREQLGFKPHDEGQPLIGELDRAQKLAEEARVRAQAKGKKVKVTQEGDGGLAVGVER